MRSMRVSRSFIGSSPSSERAVAPRRSLASRPRGPSGWWRARAAIAGARLGQVRHAEVVLDRGQLRAGRVHALEVAEGRDRLGPALRLVVRERDLQLRRLGVLVEGVLVEELLVAVDGQLVRLGVEAVLRLSPQLLGRDDRLLSGAPERDERDG